MRFCSWCELEISDLDYKAIQDDPLEVAEFMTAEEILAHIRGIRVREAMEDLDV
jgi:hypothetical protein